MKTKFNFAPVFLSFIAALAIFSSGCATPEQHSFNADYNQDLRTAPNYYIEDNGENCFKITVSQGKPSSGMENVFDVKKAATTVAGTEAKRRGWENWQLDYISERNAGWMHVVVAKVVRKNAVEYRGNQ